MSSMYIAMFLCRQIVFNGIILTTDDYFVDHQGTYQHDSRLLQEAHMWNQQRGSLHSTLLDHCMAKLKC